MCEYTRLYVYRSVYYKPNPHQISNPPPAAHTRSLFSHANVTSEHTGCSRSQTIRADMCRSQARNRQYIRHLQRLACVFCV